jgi:20S proteasome alpha/beta subunit
MGQAKRRGTYEERKAAAIADGQLMIKLIKEQEDRWWNSLSPEEQERIVKNRIANATDKEKLAALGAISRGWKGIDKS